MERPIRQGKPGGAEEAGAAPENIAQPTPLAPGAGKMQGTGSPLASLGSSKKSPKQAGSSKRSPKQAGSPSPVGGTPRTGGGPSDAAGTRKEKGARRPLLLRLLARVARKCLLPFTEACNTAFDSCLHLLPPAVHHTLLGSSSPLTLPHSNSDSENSDDRQGPDPGSANNSMGPGTVGPEGQGQGQGQGQHTDSGSAGEGGGGASFRSLRPLYSFRGPLAVALFLALALGPLLLSLTSLREPPTFRSTQFSPFTTSSGTSGTPSSVGHSALGAARGVPHSVQQGVRRWQWRGQGYWNASSEGAWLALEGARSRFLGLVRREARRRRAAVLSLTWAFPRARDKQRPEAELGSGSERGASEGGETKKEGDEGNEGRDGQQGGNKGDSSEKGAAPGTEREQGKEEEGEEEEEGGQGAGDVENGVKGDGREEPGASIGGEEGGGGRGNAAGEELAKQGTKAMVLDSLVDLPVHRWFGRATHFLRRKHVRGAPSSGLGAGSDGGQGYTPGGPGAEAEFPYASALRATPLPSSAADVSKADLVLAEAFETPIAAHGGEDKGGAGQGGRRFSAVFMVRSGKRQEVLGQAKGCQWRPSGSAPDALASSQAQGDFEWFTPEAPSSAPEPFEVAVGVCSLGDTSGRPRGAPGTLTLQGDSWTLPLLTVPDPPSASPDASHPDHSPEATSDASVSFCSPPLDASLAPTRVAEWLRFHYYAGVHRFVLYDRKGIAPPLAQVLAPFLGKGILRVVDARPLLGVAGVEMWRKGWLLAMNHCLLLHQSPLLNPTALPAPSSVEAESKASSGDATGAPPSWVLFATFDEYFFAPASPQPVLSLALQGLSESAFVTFGSLKWSVEQCLPAGTGIAGSEQWMVERMVVHQADFTCSDPKKYSLDLCLGKAGARRFVCKPQALHYVEAFEPPEGALVKSTSSGSRPSGAHVEASKAAMNVFEGLSNEAQRGSCCSKDVSTSSGWKQDTHIANWAQMLRLGFDPFV